MKTFVELPNGPEDQELEKLVVELEVLESEVVQKELDLATLKSQVLLFEKQYMKRVGLKFRELDSVEEAIERFYSRRSATGEGNPTAINGEEEFRANSHCTKSEINDSESSKEFVSTETLRQLYRDVAKMLHPDFSTDDADQKRRTEFMARVNTAYGCSDEQELRNLASEWISSPESVLGEDIGSKLVRTIRMIARVRRRLSRIDSDMNEIRREEIFVLMLKFRQGASEGRDLMEEMSANLVSKIEFALERLAGLRAASSSGREEG